MLAGLINAMKLRHADPGSMKVVVSGCGAAGSSIIRMIYQYGFHRIYAFDLEGCVDADRKDRYNPLKQELLQYVNLDHQHYASLADGLCGADIFIGVSAPRLVTREMVRSMNPQSVVFPMANPESEISYEDAKEAGAWIVGTGRSDHPNQINNLLAFPGLFRGALDCRATRITESMKIAASRAIASLVSGPELSVDYIVPSPFDRRVVPAVSAAVQKACRESGYYRK